MSDRAAAETGVWAWVTQVSSLKSYRGGNTVAQWMNRPSAPDRKHNYEILRCPPAGKLTLILLNRLPVGTLLHYWKSRSVPCTGEGCEPCKARHIPRWKGYILATGIKKSRIVILEFTERCWPAFEAWLSNHDSCRGSQITVARTNKKANGPLQIIFDETYHDPATLTADEEIESMLERMWETKQKEERLCQVEGEE